jgi:hypothetical protein
VKFCSINHGRPKTHFTSQGKRNTSAQAEEKEISVFENGDVIDFTKTSTHSPEATHKRGFCNGTEEEAGQ